MKRLIVVFTFVLIFSTTAQAVNIETVPVGNAGNAADDTSYGGVDYTYSIGKYEVTAGQYCEFLNAVAATDNYSLYNINMAVNTVGPWYYDTGCKIQQSGSPGSYS